MSSMPFPPVPPVIPGGDPDDPNVTTRPGDDSPLEEPIPADPDEDPNEQLPRD